MNSNKEAKKIIIIASIGVAVLVALLAVLLIVSNVGGSKNSDKSSSKKTEKEEKTEKKKTKKDKTKTKEEEEEDPDSTNTGMKDPDSEKPIEYKPKVREMFVDNRDPLECLAGDYYFSSGAGGWGTEIEIKDDGSFHAWYSDSDMGDMDEGYPNGTLYVGECEGKFEVVGSTDEYTYQLKLVDKNEIRAIGNEEIIDGVRNIYTETYGLDGGEEFELYLPGKLVKDITEDAYSWVQMTSSDKYGSTFLTRYMVRNVSQDYMLIGEEVSISYDFPEDEALSDISVLSGTYDGDDDTVMDIDINNVGYEGSEDGAGCGLIYFDKNTIPEHVYRQDAVLIQDDASHFSVKTYWISDYDQSAYFSWQTYNMQVSRNEEGRIVLTVYDEHGFVYAVFTKR